ncbi:MAG: hypothetical protein KAW41_01415 [Candidatus Diapherotrites archaeon]|nr:hypothetical protein [Candidatus Diapherotrites archaeon]
MEYLMTYGWAILVVIIVGIVLWQSGVFGTGGGGVSGFNRVRIEDYVYSSSGMQVSYENAAGGTMKKVNVTYEADIASAFAPYTYVSGANWAPGKEYNVTINSTVADSCPAAGGGYAVDITITYKSEANIVHTESGTIRGQCE